MPYELVFGQPPRSFVVSDDKLRGRCCEDDIIAEDHTPSHYFNILKINVFLQIKFVFPSKCVNVVNVNMPDSSEPHDDDDDVVPYLMFS